MSLLKKLFGGGGSSSGGSATIEQIDYNGFSITTLEMKEGGQYRVCAEIAKPFGDEIRTHKLIRADMCSTREEASEISLRKAKQMIDEQGDRLFG